MKRILVPTDFSENAKHALRIAAKIATQNDAKLELLHVNTAVMYAPPLTQSLSGEWFDMTDYYGIAAREMHELKTELSKHPAFEALKLETRIEEGFLYTAVRNIVREDAVDLVVMGTKGASGASEFFVGSNTEKVIRTAPCPVLVLPENSGEFEPRTVVVPTTLHRDQAAVFALLARWQKTYPFTVKVLYLNNPANLDTDAQIEKALRIMTDAHGLADVAAPVGAVTFDEETAILAFARAEKADLIAMATHQRQGLSHLLFGSLTEDTVNHSSIPVLSVPAK